MTIINTVTTAPDIKMGAREVKPTSFPTEVLPPEGYNALSKATIVAPDNLEPENIKKGVDIAGVVGTLDAVAGASKLPQVVDRTVTEITADDLKGCTKIGKYAFYKCTSLTKCTIPNTVTSIEEHSFQQTYFTSFDMPDSVTTMGDGVFINCSSLQTIRLSNSLANIGNQCFSSCSALHDVTIPASVTSMGNSCFYYVYQLGSLTMLPTTPPTLGMNALNYTGSNLVITVPKGSLEAYKTATNWSQYADKMVEASE